MFWFQKGRYIQFNHSLTCKMIQLEGREAAARNQYLRSDEPENRWNTQAEEKLFFLDVIKLTNKTGSK